MGGDFSPQRVIGLTVPFPRPERDRYRREEIPQARAVIK